MNLEKLVVETKDLLPNSQVLPRLVSLLQSADTDTTDIVKLVKIDPALTAQVIKMSNGSFYGFSESCSELDEAIGRIGLQELLKVVSLCLYKSINDKPVTNYGLNEGDLWENAVATAFAMEVLAKEVALSEGLCYTVGLLHSLGKLVINQLEGDYYKRVFERIDESSLSLIAAEREVLGFDHAQACDALLMKWSYSDDVRIPIAMQYEPMKAEPFREIACALHLAKYLVVGVGLNHGRAAMAVELCPDALDVLSIDANGLQLLMMAVHERLGEAKDLIGNTKK